MPLLLGLNGVQLGFIRMRDTHQPSMYQALRGPGRLAALQTRIQYPLFPHLLLGAVCRSNSHYSDLGLQTQGNALTNPYALG